jgi:hypothetical protein
VDFPIPPRYHQEFMCRGTHPTKLPDGSIPVATSLTVLPAPGTDPLAHRDVPYAKGKILAGDHVSFDWTRKVLLFERSKVSIPFGASPHQLMRELGCSPRGVFNLVDNRMGIHQQSQAWAGGSSFSKRLECTSHVQLQLPTSRH